jgi:hypothetical protein
MYAVLVGGECSASLPCRFTPQGKISLYPLDRRLGPHSRSGRYGEVKILDSTETRTATPRSSSPLLVSTAALAFITMLKLCLSFLIRIKNKYTWRYLCYETEQTGTDYLLTPLKLSVQLCSCRQLIISHVFSCYWCHEARPSGGTYRYTEIDL